MLLRLKTEHPFLFLLLPFMAGISLNLWVCPATGLPPIYCILALVILLFVALNVVYQYLKIDKGRQWWGGFLITVILLLAGYIAAHQAGEQNSRTFFANRKSDQLLIKVSNEPKVSGRYIRFVAEVKYNVFKQKIKCASGNLLIIIPSTAATNKLAYGDELLIKAGYHQVTPPYNAAEFNYKQYMAYQNIHYQAFINPNELQVINKDVGNRLISYAFRLRKLCVDRLKTGIIDTGAAAVASTLMLGYKADLSDDILRAYAKTGTLHVLSVSGAHVAIIYAVIVVLLGGLKRYHHGRIWSAIITITLIWGYSLLTGFSPAVCRAAVMITFYIIGKTLFRQVSSLNLLAASAFLLLMYQPLLIADVGFQLSYCAVFGLFVVQPILYRQIEINHKWLKKLWMVTSASVAAQLVTLPLSVYYFHQFPVYFLISNLIIIIPTEIIMVAGAVYILVYPVHMLAAWLGLLLNYLIVAMNTCLIYIEHLPYASVNGIWFTGIEVLLLSLLAVCVVMILHQRKIQMVVTALCSVLILCVSLSFRSYTTRNTNSITLFNLKRHSALLFKSGNRSLLVTDCLAGDKAFAYTLQPYLDSSKISSNATVGLWQNADFPFCRKRRNYVRFLHEGLLIADRTFRYQPLQSKVNVKYLYITGSPKFSLNHLARSYIYSIIIAGADNSDQTIERYQQQALSQHKIFVSLRRNKSFIIASN